jgi:8-oxo-dGTP diphosphatase
MKVVTAGILRDPHGRILVARRAPGEILAGKWEFPGGKQETDETLQECLERELHEELGIRVRARDVIATSAHVYEHGSIRLVALDVDWISGELQLRVHDAVAWLRPAEMLTIDLAPADVPIVARL